ncbi:Gpror40p [Homalodisca vitripennis]|nr:Gpror40p [Homalodisca vitripennis]
MGTSPFIAHLPRLYRIVVGYDVKTRKFNLWIVCSMISNILALGTTLCRFSLHEVSKTDALEQVTFIVVLNILFLTSTAMIRSRNSIGELIESLMEPVQTSEESLLKIKETKNYKKWVNLVGVIFMINLYFFLCCLVLPFKPLLNLMFLSNKSRVEDYPLPYGWIPFHTESHVVYVIAFLISTISNVGTGIYLTLHMTLSFAALKLKMLLKMLANDMRNFDDIVACRTAQIVVELSMTSLQQKITDRDKIMISFECRKRLLKELVERHFGMIRTVKLMNNCYAFPVLVLVQTSSFLSALILPQAIQVTKLPVWDIVYSVNAGGGSLLMVGLVCYFGQMIEDESDNLRRALYDYMWYNRSQRFKTSLKIMMAVAARPLRLTAGGIYPLNLETFSYVSILQARGTIRAVSVERRVSSGTRASPERRGWSRYKRRDFFKATMSIFLSFAGGSRGSCSSAILNRLKTVKRSMTHLSVERRTKSNRAGFGGAFDAKRRRSLSLTAQVYRDTPLHICTTTYRARLQSVGRAVPL